MVTVTSVVQRKNDLLSSNIDKEVVMMSLQNNEYYGLNKIGSRIWQLIEEPIPVNTIVLALINEYNVELETCTKEVLEYLNQLESKKIIAINE